MEMTAAVWIGIIVIVALAIALVVKYFLSSKTNTDGAEVTPIIDVCFPDASEVSEQTILAIFRKINLMPYVTVVDDVSEASMVIYTKSDKFEWSYHNNLIDIRIPLRENALTNEQTDFLISTFAQIFNYLSNVVPSAQNSMLSELVAPPLAQTNAGVFNVPNDS